MQNDAQWIQISVPEKVMKRALRADKRIRAGEEDDEDAALNIILQWAAEREFAYNILDILRMKAERKNRR